jgi:hypothetical protein
MIRLGTRRATASMLAALVLSPASLAVPVTGEGNRAATTEAARWKINTHLFAANKALDDAVDGFVTIPPFGDIPVSPAALRALKAAPSAYRAGVLAPDLFPDMYVGGWFIHSDLEKSEGWKADDWMRHVWSKARAHPNADERDKVMAFAFGFLTHGAGDMFAHTWVNKKADGAWISFEGELRKTAIKHIVLEGYVGEHTPTSNLTMDVWPRFVSNTLIKDTEARKHMGGARHYQKFLELYGWLDGLIERAKSDMNRNVDNDAPYWVKCAAHPVTCAKKEQMETWRLDINRGLRALVDSSESLGERLMDGETAEGLGVMTGWMTEWLPKMFGAHAIGEGAAALQQFLAWTNIAAPINEAIKAETDRFFRKHFSDYYDLYHAARNPSSYMDQLDFPPGTKAQVNREMGLGGSNRFDWRAFEPMYNTVILSKLALLDGNGLNELARRAGVTGEFVPAGEATNVMLGTFRSMTHSYQWMGAVVDADTIGTRFGICGPETTIPLPKKALCGIQLVGRPARGATTDLAGGGGRAGFVLWGNPDARERIFKVVFKGFGPGPGATADRAIGDMPIASVAAVRQGRRSLRLLSDQVEYLREIVQLLPGRIPGVAPASQPGRLAAPNARTAPGTAPASTGPITDWGRRCCGTHIDELRAGLAAIQRASGTIPGPAVLVQLGRRTTATQIPARVASLQALLDAFANTRDAATAAAALANFSNQLDALAAVITGTQ